MIPDAERNGAAWAKKNDSRITRVGRIMRKTRLDELPQLWNLVVGDMSLIGPRPERPEFVSQLEEQFPYYAVRHSVKPGITGWAQVRYRYGNTTEDALIKLQYDLYYVKHWGPLLDISIILNTIRVVLSMQGN
jgi:lipopolysaccharide/colanic/teichoic acid biosynthesis glycosyltransferase